MSDRPRVRGERLFRLLLLAYPRAFRLKHGEQMALYFRDSRRASGEAGMTAIVGLWASVLLDWFAAVPREHLRERSQGSRRAAGRGPVRAHRLEGLATIVQDLRYGARTLRRKPSVTAVAVATLALGIGSTTAVFSVVHEVVLRTLPYPEPDRLIHIEIDRTLSKHTVDVLKRDANLLDEVSGYSGWGFTLTGEGDPIELSGGHVSSNHFSALRANVAFGRALVPGDEARDRAGVVVISHGLWTRHFGSDSSVIGRTITLGGAGRDTRTVVGVMAPDHEPLEPGWDVWVPLQIDRSPESDYRRSWYLSAFGRLKPGVTPRQAAEQINALAVRLREDQPQIFSEQETETAGAVPLHDVIVSRQTRVALYVLMGAVGLVLLVACTNVANLLLARAGDREREFAVRVAMGAGRTRLLRQLLTESLLLGALGGAAGVLLAFQAVSVIGDRLTEHVSRVSVVAVDFWALGFATIVSVGAALVFGVAPALLGARTDPQQRLRGGRQTSRRRFRVNRALIVGEIALATVLVVGAGLLLKSFWRLQQVPPGFDGDGVVTMKVTLPAARYHEGEQWRQFFDAALREVRAVPGVDAAGAIHLLPLTPGNWGFPYSAEDHPVDPEVPLPSANYRVVTPGYFETMQIPLIAGRTLTELDRRDAPLVTVINRTMAGELWPDENPLGKEIVLFNDSDYRFRVVGVVGDVRQHRLDLRPQPEMYYALEQRPTGQMNVVARTDSDAPGRAAAVREAIWRIDANVPISRVAEMEDVVALTLVDERMVAWLLTAFAVVSLVLGAVGVYGVTAYVTSQRTHEIGVRMALGADRGRVVREILGKGMGPVVLGIGLGALAALGTGRLASGLLYEVQPHDPFTLGGVSVFLLWVALLACWVPSRRAARVDPTASLRHE